MHQHLKTPRYSLGTLKASQQARKFEHGGDPAYDHSVDCFASEPAESSTPRSRFVYLSRREFGAAWSVARARGDPLVQNAEHDDAEVDDVPDPRVPAVRLAGAQPVRLRLSALPGPRRGPVRGALNHHF